MASPFDEAKGLFKQLGKINNLIFEAQSAADAQGLWIEVLHRIEKNTLNVKWWSSISDNLTEPIGQEWKFDALDKLNPTLMRASQVSDPIQQGIIYVRCGHYANAQQVFSGTDPELIELCSHLNTFLQNWAYIECSSVKLFNCPKYTPNTEIIINAALANFCLCEYRSCAAILLRLKVSAFSEAHSIWLTSIQVRTIFAYAVLLGLNSRELRHFYTEDDLAKIMLLEPLLESYLGYYELPPLRKQLASELTDLPVSTIGAQAALHDKVSREWLELQDKVPLRTAIESFGTNNYDTYDEFDLSEDLQRLNLPYSIDLVNGWVEMCSPPPPNTNEAAQKLSSEYIRDLVLLTWAKQNDKYIV